MKRTVNPRGNAFLELGFPPEEAAVLKMRADLMGDLREFIRDSGLTLAAVAQRLGISQSRVSDLVRGKWEKFSLETSEATALGRWSRPRGTGQPPRDAEVRRGPIRLDSDQSQELADREAGLLQDVRQG